MPPKIYHYEPKIAGFKIVGKRGSKYFNPPTGNIEYNWASMTQLDKEKLIMKTKEQNRLALSKPKVLKELVSTAEDPCPMGIMELGGQFANSM